MKKIVFIVFFLFYLIIISEPIFFNDVNRSLEYVYNTDYEHALLIADSIIEKYCDYPVGYYLKMAIFSTYMSDFETDTLYDSMIYYYDKIMEYNDNNAYNTFFIGGAYFHKASYFTLKGKYFSALKYSLKAKKYFNKSLEQDSLLYDAFLGVGLVKYFTDKFKSKLPFKGMNKQGIEDIEIAAQKGLFSRVPAYDMLAMIYAYEGEKEKALVYSKHLLSAYPENRMFLFTEYKVYLFFNDTVNCIRTLHKLEKRIIETQSKTYYNLLFVYSTLSEMYYKTSNYEKAKEYANKTLEYEYAEEIDKRVENFIKKANSILKKL